MPMAFLFLQMSRTEHMMTETCAVVGFVDGLCLYLDDQPVQYSSIGQ